MPREPAADSIQGRLPSCNDASGTSGAQKAEELAAALERERALRQQHEQALEAALDEVMERSRLLQRRMDRGSIRHTLDGELGSPRRLQSLARRGGTKDPFEEGEVLNRLGHEEMDDEVQRTRAGYETEIRQLRATIGASRDRLDGLKFTSDDEINQQDSRHRDEVKQLHNTIQALRDRLESNQANGAAG